MWAVSLCALMRVSPGFRNLKRCRSLTDLHGNPTAYKIPNLVQEKSYQNSCLASLSLLNGYPRTKHPNDSTATFLRKLLRTERASPWRDRSIIQRPMAYPRVELKSKNSLFGYDLGPKKRFSITIPTKQKDEKDSCWSWGSAGGQQISSKTGFSLLDDPDEAFLEPRANSCMSSPSSRPLFYFPSKSPLTNSALRRGLLYRVCFFVF